MFSLQTLMGGMSVQKIRQNRSLGYNIRKLRLAAHMTQEQVTAKLQLAGCDITRSIYSQIESGSYNIRVNELVALTEIFGVDFNTLFADVDKT